MDTLGNRKWWALVALTLVVVVVGIDATVLNLALPALAGALHASSAELQWFVAAYSLAVPAMLLPAGLLGDRYGRRRMLLGALAVFGAGSLACAYAPSAGAFIAARLLLGLAAAFLVTLSLAVLPVLFAEQERPRAVGIWAAANFVSLPIGPLLGGWLLTHFWWGTVFLINVPVVGLAIVATLALLPESRSPVRPGLDPLGVLTSSAGLAGIIYGIIQGGQQGWGDAGALGPLLGGVLLLGAFVLWERRVSRRPAGQPLVDLGLFRSPSFTWGTLLAAVGIFPLFGVMFALSQYWQAVLGVDAQGAGLRLLPVIAGLVVGAGVADRVAARAGAKLTVAGGFAVLAGAMIAGGTTSLSSGDGFTAVWTAVTGAGTGLALATAANAALGALPAERSGVGSALMQAVQKVGAPFAVAILGAALNAGYRDHLALAGLPAPAAAAVQQSVYGGLAIARQLGSAALADSVRQAFVAGLDAALWVCAGLALAALVLALAFLPRRVAEPGATDAAGVQLRHEVVRS
ncbi:MAG TPA: MFS transporter [Chloroflexia bacterium]|nr:MFS transporter [Chloroflexia bacterium]